MAVLVGYDSSDEDDEVQVQPTPETQSPRVSSEVMVDTNGKQSTAYKQKGLSHPDGAKSGIFGPMPQPEDAANPIFPPLEDAPMEDEVPGLPPGSPYSAKRALLRDLTLPTVPNMDIPPSPPGSPPPGINKKFEQFLELKKKGVHFNSKIAQSSALKNPGLMDKLMAFVGLDQKDQYNSTLDTQLWDPIGFPKSAYKEQLRLSQTEIGQARARAKGTPVEFVASAGSSQNTAPTTVPMSFLDGATKPTIAPASNPGKRKSRFDT